MEANTAQKSLNRAHIFLEEGRNGEALAVLETLNTDIEIQERDRRYLFSWYYILSKKWYDASQQLLPLLSPFRIGAIEQEELLDRERPAMYLLRLGQVAVLLAHYEDASRHFLHCLKIIHDRRLQLPALRIEAQYNLAMTYKMRGLYALAIRNYEDALRLCHYHQLPTAIADIYYGLSETYRSQGDFTKAHDAAREALSIYQANHNEPLQSRMYNILGKISLLLGDYNASETYYVKSLALAMSNDRPLMIMLNCAALAELFLEKEQMSVAKEYAHRALEIATRVEDVFLRGVVYTTLGKITLAEAQGSDDATRQPMFDEAISWFKKAVEEFQSRQAFVNVAEVYSRLAALSEELGHTKEAIAYWKLAYIEKDNVKPVPYVIV